MMINSCSYSNNDHVFIKFQIFNQDLSRCLASANDSKLSFEANFIYTHKIFMNVFHVKIVLVFGLTILDLHVHDYTVSA